MSSAFVKEEESEWLWEIAPNVSALSRYLTRDNGKYVHEKATHQDKNGETVYEMSNGLSYILDKDQKWQLLI